MRDNLPRAALEVLRALRNTTRRISTTIRNRSRLRTLRHSSAPLRIELGSTTPREGWTTIDHSPSADLVHDLHMSLPFAPDSVDQIYSSHFLEHLFYPDLRRLLMDCLRVLKPGGRFDAAVPDASIYIAAYLDDAELDEEIYCRHRPAFHFFSKIDYVNYIAYMDAHHRHMFDTDSLVAILQEVGFCRVANRSFLRELDLPERRQNSIYAVAYKQGTWRPAKHRRSS